MRDHYTFSPLELQRLFELTIVNFAIVNADAHLKSVSLLTGEDGTVSLSPVYNLVSSRLVMADEADELALTVGGKRSRLRRDDFLALAQPHLHALVTAGLVDAQGTITPLDSPHPERAQRVEGSERPESKDTPRHGHRPPKHSAKPLSEPMHHPLIPGSSSASSQNRTPHD